jgi:hypothetical protein
LLEFYVEAVLATFVGALKKKKVSIAGPGPALRAVLEGLIYYNSPNNSPSRTGSTSRIWLAMSYVLSEQREIDRK